MTRKFTFLLMALLALAGLQGWANPVVSSPSGSNDRETYNIAIADLTPNRWDFFCSLSAEEGSTVQVSYSPVTGYETYEPHVICEITGTHESIDISDFTDAGDYYYANFTMPANNVTVTASFEPSGDLYNVHPQTPFTGGTVNIDHINNLSEGTMVKMWVTPDTQNHYTFDAAHYQDKISVKYGENLSQSVTVSAYSNYYFFYMPAADVTVDVIFDEEPNHTITVNNPEGCTITVLSEPKYYEGREIYFEYELASGYRFNSWNVKYDDGVHVSPQSVTVYDNKPWNGDYYFIMPEGPVTITANVTHVTTHTITVVQPAVGGTISVSTTEAATGDPVYIYTYPAQGYTLNKWYVKNENGDVVLEDVTAGFYMPDFNVTVTATFIKPETLTVFGNGGPYDYNSIYPIYTYWGDAVGTTSQFIIPAEELENMAGGTIKGMKFFISSNGGTGGQIWECRVKEVDYKALNGIVDVSTLTPVYSGHYLAFEDSKWNLTFDTPFAYSGKNLLVSFQCTTNGSYKSNSFYGENVDYYASWSSREGGSTFIPKTEFTYFPDPTAVFYDVEIAQVEGGTITASKTRAKADTEIELSVNMEEGYTFSRWIVKDADNQDVTVTDNIFTMPASNVTVTAEYNALPRYNVTLVQSAGGSITATPCENVLEGKWVKLVATPDHGYRFVSWSGSTEAGETLYIATVATSGFTMRASNATVTATFETLPTYEVNYYANGSLVNTLNPYEGEDVDITPCEVPAGVNFYGWATSEINENPYLTAAPSVITAGTPVNADMNLYAVFKYAEETPAAKGDDKWVEVTSPSDLSNGDQVIFVEKNNNKVLTARTGEYDGCFRSADVTISSNEINSIPSNAVVFEADNTSGSWKFWFEDAFRTGLTTLTDCNGGYLVPVNMNWGGSDLWTIISNGSSVNIIGASNQPIVYKSGDFTTESSSVYKRSALFKKYNPVITTNYYMTSVLTGGTVANATFKNIIVANPITVSGRLEMNAGGLFRNANAANFVFADGAQFYYTGTENVNATFQKNITGYTGDNDHYYLIANPTDETVVVNLTSNEFDLYTFDGAQEVEWRNAKEDDNFEVERGAGYLYANSKTVTLEFAGELTPAGSTVVDLIYAEEGDGIDFPGFNLIGNPFACNATISGTGLRSSNYYYMMNAGGTALEVVVNPILAPCTGVFAVAANSDATVTFTQANTNGIDVTRSEKNAVQDIRVELLANGKVIDRAYLNMNGESLPKFRLQDNISEICFYQDKEELAVVSTSSTSGEIPVSFKAEKNGSYTINVNTENVEAQYLHLIDNMTGMDTDLLSTSSYTFNASTRDYAYRFKLVFSMTGVEENGSNANSYAYINNGNLVIDHIEGEATMQIVDVLGRVVSTEIVSGSYNKALNLKAGLYIINLNGMTQKIVVK